MKKTIFNGAVLLSVLLCFSLVLFAACDTGTSGDSDDTETPIENPVDDPADDPASAPASKLDFESANIATLSNDGFDPEMGDVRATWDDVSTNGTAVSDMVFAADTSIVETGSASLKVTATALQNQYSTDTSQWSFKTVLSAAGIASPVNLKGKTVSIRALVPATGNLSAVKLVFWSKIGEVWSASQGTGVVVDTKDAWTTVTYKFGDASDYTASDFDIENVVAVSVVAIRYGATAESSETLYLDSLDW
ncbi:MAG: hypothetical protein BWY20_01539 [Spirochaetes bacterium ADurb.Bin215]|nr:MAG: hypothetical protein BWY20_01539 [Spirochaetes bacterium ADurb.Bin215]